MRAWVDIAPKYTSTKLSWAELKPRKRMATRVALENRGPLEVLSLKATYIDFDHA